jgi:hypothetical protein
MRTGERQVRSSCRVFVSWTHETEPAARMVLDRLSKAGLDPWISSEIRPGQRFRTEIRQRIRSADLVIAIFASDPSHWLTAEAGLAYFEEKLIPVAIDQANVVEPFSELQAHTLFSEDIDAGGGPSVDSLIDRVRTRLGHNVQHPLLNDLFRISNAAFFAGVPILGLPWYAYSSSQV